MEILTPTNTSVIHLCKQKPKIKEVFLPISVLSLASGHYFWVDFILLLGFPPNWVSSSHALKFLTHLHTHHRKHNVQFRKFFLTRSLDFKVSSEVSKDFTLMIFCKSWVGDFCNKSKIAKIQHCKKKCFLNLRSS